jgi:hypothetical protein
MFCNHPMTSLHSNTLRNECYVNIQ